MDRRKFLYLSMLAGGGAATFGASQLFIEQHEQLMVHGLRNPETIAGYGDTRDKIVAAMELPSHISLFNLGLQRQELIDSPSSLHHIMQMRNNKNILVGFPKWGFTGLVVDVSSPRNNLPIKTPEGFVFSGHGAEDFTGQFVFAGAQENRPYGRSYLLKYLTKDWSLVDKIAAGGASPHDLQFYDDKTMILSQITPESSDAGLSGFLSVFNVINGEVSLRKHLPVPYSGHMSMLSGGRVALGGWAQRKRQTGIYVFDMNSSSDVPLSLDIGGFWGEPSNIIQTADDQIVIGYSDRKGFGSLRFNGITQNAYKHFSGQEKGAVVVHDSNIYFIDGPDGWLRRAHLSTPHLQSYLGTKPVGYAIHGIMLRA